MRVSRRAPDLKIFLSHGFFRTGVWLSPSSRFNRTIDLLLTSGQPHRAPIPPHYLRADPLFRVDTAAALDEPLTAFQHVGQILAQAVLVYP